jgi:hypothetical protein
LFFEHECHELGEFTRIIRDHSFHSGSQNPRKIRVLWHADDADWAD